MASSDSPWKNAEEIQHDPKPPVVYKMAQRH